MMTQAIFKNVSCQVRCLERKLFTHSPETCLDKILAPRDPRHDSGFFMNELTRLSGYCC